jgi:putative Mn2+ efflux pump MntP
MPLLGAALGNAIGQHFAYTHFVAAAILFIIAGKMIKDARAAKADDDAACAPTDPTKSLRIIVLAVSTSIDAFGVGIPISLMQASIWFTSGVIGVVCLVVSWIGFYAGRAIAGVFKNAEYLGAAVLIGIGVKMMI